MHRYLILGIAAGAVILAGCAREREKIADTAKGEVAATPAPAVLTLAEVAGTWNVRAVPDSGDTTVTTFVLHARADTAGWTIVYAPNREPIPLTVTVSGDSLVIDSAPYLSGRRPGIKAQSHDIYRLVDGRLVGYGVGTYLTGPRDTLRMKYEGTRAP